MSVHPLLAHLNPEQLQGALSIEGVILLEAGPGTGKTATTTSRAAYMVNQGIDPTSILMLTFTNKAANEMKDRVVEKIGLDGHRICVTTFHKFVARWVLSKNQSHEFFQSLGFDKGFICLDAEDAEKLLKEAIKKVHPDIQKILESLGKTPKQIMSWLSVVRAKGFDAKQYHHQLLTDDPALKEVWSDIARRVNLKVEGDSGFAHDLEQEFQLLLKKHPKAVDLALCQIWKVYKEQCLSVAGIDYDDMLVMTDKLLKADPTIAKRLAGQFQYISIDEMQDTNPVQMSIISQIAAHHGKTPNLFMVGDPRQSIYGFRAADVTIMTSMPQRYENTKVISLVRNYRSSEQQIVTNNAHAITMNGQLSDGQLIPNKQSNTPAQVNVFDHDYEEAVFVSTRVQSLIADGVPPSEIAVLYRSRAVKAEIEKILATDNVNYTVIGDTTFWERKEVKDAVAFVRFCSRPNDIMAASRVLDAITLGATGQHMRKNVHQYGNGAKEYITFVGEKKQKSKPDLKRFADRVAQMKPAYFCELDQSIFLQSMLLTQEEFNQIRPTLTLSELNNLTRVKDELNTNIMQGCADVIYGLWEDFALPRIKAEVMKKVDKNKITMDEGLEEFNLKKERAVAVFTQLKDMIANNVSFNEASDELSLRVENAHIYDANAVQLMTIHAAKGLEFEHVFLPGLEHENFFKGDEETMTDNFDEESRIFFVGISRDKSCKYLSFAHNRFVNGQARDNEPLAFIDNIIDHCKVVNHSKFVELPTDNTIQNAEPPKTNQSNHQSSNRKLAFVDKLLADNANDDALLSPAQLDAGDEAAVGLASDAPDNNKQSPQDTKPVFTFSF